MVNTIEDKINKSEQNILKSLSKNAIHIMSQSIIEIENLKNTTNIQYMLLILHLQISVELLIKYYICTKYGFSEILTNEYKKDKINKKEQYLKALNNTSIKTLGFNETKKFLEKSRDCFSYVIKEGIVPVLEIEYDNLIGLFDKFHSLRNGFVHLGIDLTEADKQWLQHDFYNMIIFFASILLCEVDKIKFMYNYRKVDKNNYTSSLYSDSLDETAIDILSRHLSYDAIKILKKSKVFECIMIDIAENMSANNELYECVDCGMKLLALNVNDSDGWSKCFGCGLMYHAGYTDCSICGDVGSVTFDIDNIDFNNNILPAFCHSCKQYSKVYKCPECECEYNYDSKIGVKEFYLSCCERNFVDNIIRVEYLLKSINIK